MPVTLKVRKYNQEGNLAHEYKPLRNVWNIVEKQNNSTNQSIKPNELADFKTTEINVDLNNPLNIECQPSYDGTVNLIINDDKNPPRVINSRFSVIEDNRYRIINRNQKEQTNIYEEGKIDQQTRLFRNINTIPTIQLVSINTFGQLKGGNYTFYVKFADNDFNKTDVVCESGQVSIFNGTISNPATVTGTLQDERTNKSIQLKINNIDTSFQKIYLYFNRESCDVNGVRISEFGMFKQPYEIKNNSVNITINGYEEVQPISEAELNIRYLYVDRVKTQAQNQGMLFFGNVEMTTINPVDLQSLSLYIQVNLVQDENSIGYVSTDYKPQDSDDAEQTEYYNPLNIYYHLGYWPNEMYRLGIVYIMRDDSLSEVFNLRGIRFEYKDIVGHNSGDPSDIESNIRGSRYEHWYAGVTKPGSNVLEWGTNSAGMPLIGYSYSGVPKYANDWSEVSINYVPKDDFILNGTNLDNIMGIFQLPHNLEILDHQNKQTHPVGFRISFPVGLREYMRSLGVKGFFIVRQKRIPTTLCQGLSIAVDRSSYIPCIPVINSSHTEISYHTESFINSSGTLSSDFKDLETKYKSTSALLSIDPGVVPLLQSTFDGSEYVLQADTAAYITRDNRRYITESLGSNNQDSYWNSYKNSDSVGNVWISPLNVYTNLIWVGEDIPYKAMGAYSFSTRAGAAEEVKQISFFAEQNYDADNRNLLRGIWGPFIGTSSNLNDGWIYNVKIKNYSNVFIQEYFKIRGHDNSPFYAISDRYAIDDSRFAQDENGIIGHMDVYRGDCYTCTVTMHLQRNFVDSDVPTNTIIVDPNTWKDNYAGYNTTDEDGWLSINRGDVNTCPIGSWITWKCLSNYNLGLRAQDYTNVEEMALMGNPRSFYPIQSDVISVAAKLAESWKLNEGYSATVSQKYFLPVQDVPYTRDIFDTRIMFSNVQQDDAFQNAYRIFQGLSFEDMDRQYGGLVKLISWGTSLLAIFEHGITIIPVNEKALLATTTGQSVHVYGDGVLQKQMSIISQDYGTIWQESIIKTPLGVYGVDTYAKKIWRFSQDKGLELISDAKIQRYLNDHIKLKEKDKYPTVALRNVKSHYNNYKGDVMFTFYNDTEEEEWNICYNERLDKWSTRYSWIPLYSDNVNNIYYSLDKKRAEILAYIYNNINASSGIISLNSESNQWQDRSTDHSIHLKIKNYNFWKYFHFEIEQIKSSYLDENGVEHFVDLDNTLATWTSNTTLVTNSDLKRLELHFTDNIARQGQGVLKLNKNILIKDGYPILYLYFIIKATPYNIIDPITEVSETILTGNITVGDTFKTVFGIVMSAETLSQNNLSDANDQLLKNGFYVHGRAGIFDEIDYFDESRTNEILPTVWYDKQEPFEFEFVVNEPAGLHKIFNNLVIISNNVQPSEIEYEIVGDVYGFNKAGIFWKQNNSIEEKAEWSDKYNTPVQFLPKEGEPFIEPYPTSEGKPNPTNGSVRYNWLGKTNPMKTSEDFKNTTVEWDPILNQYLLKTNQKCYDIKEYGRMRGNITYKEDAWYLTIDPIRFKKADSENSAYGVTGNTEIDDERLDWKSTRIRDKWCKIRIKYTGKDLVLISAIKTMIMTSYA